MTAEKVELPKRTFTIELYVGIFAIVGILCFAYLATNIAGIEILKKNAYQIKAEFDDVSGLKLGAPVEIAGVPIGEVVRIHLQETSALVGMRITDNIKVRDDDIAAIRTKGIIGDRYVKIIPGGSEDILGPDGEISDTESAVELEAIIGKFIHKME